MPASKHKRIWMPALEVARTLGVGPEAVKKMGEDGVLGTIAIPGLPVRYSAADVRELAARSVRPARANRELVEA